MKIEVIMSAYNNVRDLKLVLDGYVIQSDQDFSICIADDGSGPEVKELIGEYKNLNIRHIWQEDRGFRRTKILNKGIASSSADHIIFTDGDCIPAPDFIADHRKMASKNTYTIGVRVYVKREISELLRTNVIDFKKLFNTKWLLVQSLQKKVTKPEQAIRYPNFLLPLIVKLKPRMTQFGSNIAMSREVLNEVNGLDEDYEGWGYEDTDLLWRLSQKGLAPVGKLGRCCQYHLDHKVSEENKDAKTHFLRKKSIGNIRCLNGLEKLVVNYTNSDLTR